MNRVARWIGSPVALLLVVSATFSGHFWGWSEGWWLWTDRVVYLATLWLALVLQSAQNRDTAAMQAKLDDIIRELPGTNRAVGLENQSSKAIEEVKKHA